MLNASCNNLHNTFRRSFKQFGNLLVLYKETYSASSCWCRPKEFHISASCFTWIINYCLSVFSEQLSKGCRCICSNSLLVIIADSVCTAIVPCRLGFRKLCEDSTDCTLVQSGTILMGRHPVFQLKSTTDSNSVDDMAAQLSTALLVLIQPTSN